MTRNVNAPQSAADEGKSWDCGPAPKHILCTYRLCVCVCVCVYIYICMYIINARIVHVYNMYVCKLHICAPSCNVVLEFLVFCFFCYPPLSPRHT